MGYAALAKVQTGWTGTIAVTYGGITTTVTPRTRESVASLFARLVADVYTDSGLALSVSVGAPGASGYAFYRSDGAAGSYAAASTNVAARAVFTGTGDPTGTIIFWLRATPTGGFGSAYAMQISDDGLPSMALNAWDDGGSSALSWQIDGASAPGGGSDDYIDFTAAFTQFAYVFDAGTGAASFVDYLNSAATSSADTSFWSPYANTDALTLFADYLHANMLAGDIRAFAVFDRALTSGEVAALYAAGVGHDLTTATGAYTTPDPVVLWDAAAVASSVANRGSGGVCALTLHGGVTSETEGTAAQALTLSAAAAFTLATSGTVATRTGLASGSGAATYTGATSVDAYVPTVGLRLDGTELATQSGRYVSTGATAQPGVVEGAQIPVRVWTSYADAWAAEAAQVGVYDAWSDGRVLGRVRIDGWTRTPPTRLRTGTMLLTADAVAVSE